MRKVRIDKEKCIGCGLCTSIAENSFRINEEGKAEFLPAVSKKEAKIQEAINSCPVTAISWEE